MTPAPSPDLVVDEDGVARCPWGASSPEYRAYHDEEWGRPVHGDQEIFEKLSLEAFQSGLAWITILRKREGFRAAFDGFDPVVVAAYGPGDVERLMADAGIVRNRAKIAATVANSRAVLALVDADGPGALDRLFWSYRPARHPRPRSSADIPATSPESVALAKALRKVGFAFVGPTTAYAALQALGVVDDHLAGCVAAAP
ncbi:MAG TPA: DNA-3-methyladenine glycosylase I [Candidatus Nanopelagicales bacterium]